MYSSFILHIMFACILMCLYGFPQSTKSKTQYCKAPFTRPLSVSANHPIFLRMICGHNVSEWHCGCQRNTIRWHPIFLLSVLFRFYEWNRTPFFLPCKKRKGRKIGCQRCHPLTSAVPYTYIMSAYHPQTDGMICGHTERMTEMLSAPWKKKVPQRTFHTERPCERSLM